MKSQPAANQTASDRSHCPSDRDVRAYADGKIPDFDGVAQHVQNCECCKREYLDHKRDLAEQQFVGNSTKLMYVVIAGIVLFSVLRSCQ